MPSHLQTTEDSVDWRSVHLGDAEYDLDDDENELDQEEFDDEDGFDDDFEDDDDED
jgi:hypothetical protein